MSEKPSSAQLVQDTDVYSLTDRGTAELRGHGGTFMPPDQLSLLVLMDGRATVSQVLSSASGMDREAALKVIGKLAQDGFIAPAGKLQHDYLDAGDFFSVTTPMKIPVGAEAEAGPELAEGVSTLRDQGYYVRIARRAAAQRKVVPGQKLSVLVIEDEQHLAKLLVTYLKLEGFVARVAANRDDIVAAFGQPAAPDLVLLDVTLPDADGFDILGRIRQHPLLRAVPVVMLTAKATREAVLKGLQGGADGYITKPFEIDVLMHAVKTVVGLIGAPPPAPEPVKAHPLAPPPAKSKVPDPKGKA